MRSLALAIVSVAVLWADPASAQCDPHGGVRFSEEMIKQIVREQLPGTVESYGVERVPPGACWMHEALDTHSWQHTANLMDEERVCLQGRNVAAFERRLRGLGRWLDKALKCAPDIDQPKCWRGGLKGLRDRKFDAETGFSATFHARIGRSKVALRVRAWVCDGGCGTKAVCSVVGADQIADLQTTMPKEVKEARAAAFAGAGAPAEEGPACGNGLVDDGEECDPGAVFLNGCPPGSKACRSCNLNCRFERWEGGDSNACFLKDARSGERLRFRARELSSGPPMRREVLLERDDRGRPLAIHDEEVLTWQWDGDRLEKTTLHAKGHEKERSSYITWRYPEAEPRIVLGTQTLVGKAWGKGWDGKDSATLRCEYDASGSLTKSNMKTAALSYAGTWAPRFDIVELDSGTSIRTDVNRGGRAMRKITSFKGKIHRIESLRFFPGGMEASVFSADGGRENWYRVTEHDGVRTDQLWTYGSITTRRTTRLRGGRAKIALDFQSDGRWDETVIEDRRCRAGNVSQLPLRPSLTYAVATRAFHRLDRYTYFTYGLACPPTIRPTAP